MQISKVMAYTIVQREGGLLQVKKVLQEGEADVKRAAVCLLKNMSRYKELHSDISKHFTNTTHSVNILHNRLHIRLHIRTPLLYTLHLSVCLSMYLCLSTVSVSLCVSLYFFLCLSV